MVRVQKLKDEELEQAHDHYEGEDSTADRFKPTVAIVCQFNGLSEEVHGFKQFLHFNN